MSKNRNRSNYYFAGSSALVLPGQGRIRPDGRRDSTGGAPYVAASDMSRPAPNSSALAANIQLPGNVVELFPGAVGSCSAGPCPVAPSSVVGSAVGAAPGAGATSKSRRSTWLMASEAGMATAEYAIATLAAVGFAGLLVFILRSDEVRGFLLNLIRTALALP